MLLSMAETTSGSEKLSVSLPKSTVSNLREHVGRGAVSGFITEAVEEKLRREAMIQWLEEAEKARGRPLSSDELAEAEEPFIRAQQSLEDSYRRGAT